MLGFFSFVKMRTAIFLTGIVAPINAAQAARIVYDMNITYVDNVNPDNLKARQVVGVNGVWP
jgi:iron transport multicopper oxidase